MLESLNADAKELAGRQPFAAFNQPRPKSLSEFEAEKRSAGLSFSTIHPQGFPWEQLQSIETCVLQVDFESPVGRGACSAVFVAVSDLTTNRAKTPV